MILNGVAEYRCYNFDVVVKTEISHPTSQTIYFWVKKEKILEQNYKDLDVRIIDSYIQYVEVNRKPRQIRELEKKLEKVLAFFLMYLTSGTELNVGDRH